MAIAIKSDFAAPWLSKGLYLSDLGRCAESLEALNKATESNSFYVPHAWYAKARLYSVQKDKSNALRCLRKAIQCKHFQLEYLKNDTHFNFIRNEKEFQSLFSN